MNERQRLDNALVREFVGKAHAVAGGAEAAAVLAFLQGQMKGSP